MVAGIVDQPVVGEDDALRPARALAERVDVALGIAAPLCLGELALIVAEAVAADAFAGGIGLQRAAGPAERLGLLLGDEVRGQVAVLQQIGADVLLRGIAAVLVQRGGLPLRRGQEDKALIAVAGIVDQPVVGIDQPLIPA